MFSRIISPTTHSDVPHEIYGGLVSRARNRTLYTELGVPDSIDGRFDMMVMHVFLLAHRLKDQDATCRALSQDIFDVFLLDMDRGLREEGVGDLTVPKRLKKMTQIFYGRAGAYERPLNDRDIGALATVVDRNLFTQASDPANAGRLAEYMMRVADHLEHLTVNDLLHGRLRLDTVEPQTTVPIPDHLP